VKELRRATAIPYRRRNRKREGNGRLAVLDSPNHVRLVTLGLGIGALGRNPAIIVGFLIVCSVAVIL
jgi:hypothetical protein